MYKIKNSHTYRKKSSRGKRLIVLGSLLISLLAIAGIVFYRNQDTNKPGTEEITTNSDGIDLGPPTEEEKNPARDVTPPAQNNPSSTKQQVKPFITSADNKEVRAYVPGVIEEGGLCTATFTHGQDKVSATSSSFANVNHTSCNPMKLEAPLNISGEWTVVVSYSSAAYEGASEPYKIKVQ